MALTPEDKKDVKGALGKALANKVSKVTKDGKAKAHSWKPHYQNKHSATGFLGHKCAHCGTMRS